MKRLAKKEEGLAESQSAEKLIKSKDGTAVAVVAAAAVKDGPAEEKRKREEKGETKAKKVAKGGAGEEIKEESKKDLGQKKIKLEVMLAHVFDPEKHDPTGWWMSEKLDGVRAYWTGANIYSRAGNKFYAPSYFKEALPKGVELDGELWTKRDDFQKCVSIVKRQDYNDEWKTLTYMVFDAPGLKGKNFTERLEKLKEIIGEKKSPYLSLHEHVVCESPEQLLEATDRVIEKGGEGMMLRDPESMYEKKRSFALLKVKKFEDAEATVIGHEAGKGRLTGLVGALVV
jgi:DNA ligase-1